MGTALNIVVYGLKTQFQLNKKFTYHSISKNTNNRLNNEYYDFKVLIGEINKNKTMQIQYYESKCICV